MPVREVIATLTLALGLAGGIGGPFIYEKARRIGAGGGDADREIRLTGVARTGTWTDRDVTGLNYASGDFPAARPAIQVGEDVRLVLRSADVSHSFYCPDLEVGPIDVYPGRTEVVRFRAEEPGTYRYYCTAVCGPCHYYMQGEIVVLARGEPPPETAGDGGETRCEHPSMSEAPAGFVSRGAYLFRGLGCITCHGRGGHGGIPNPNYIKKTVPALNTLAETLQLWESEDAQAIISLLEEGRDLSTLEDDPPVERYPIVLAQLQFLRTRIRDGNVAGREDPEGPDPPLQMPAWGAFLSDRDIDAILAYLISQYPWEEEGE